MKSVSMYFKSAFIALAIIVSVAPVHGMMWSPSYWLAKTPKAAEKTVKEETAKVVEKVAEKVVEKTTPGQYAVQGALAVARVTGKTAVSAAEFALDHPKLSLITAAGAAIYLNREKIKEKLNEYKPYLKVAGGGIALAGAVIAGKNLYDAYCAYRSLTGSAQEVQSENPLPKVQVAQQKPIEKVKANALKEAREENFDDYEALWNEYLQQDQEQRANALAPSEVENFDSIYRAVAQPAEIPTQQIQQRVVTITPSEVENFNAVYSAAVNQNLPSIPSQPAQISAQKAAETQAIEAVEDIPKVNKEQLALEAAAPMEETPEQFSQRFTREFQDGDISHQRPLIHHVLIPQPVPFRDTDTPWVEEFHESEASKQADHPWVEEFEKQQEYEKCIEDLQNELGAEPVAVISDSLTSDVARDARQMNRLQENFNVHMDRMSNIVGHISPERNQGRVRIVHQDHAAVNRAQQLVCHIQSIPEPARRPQNHARATVRIPADNQKQGRL